MERYTLLSLLLAIFLAATPSFATTELRDGVAFQGRIRTGQWEYFTFNVSHTAGAEGGQNVIVDVTPFSDFSDPDVFISKTAQPSDAPSHFDYKATLWGADSLEIPLTELQGTDVLYIGLKCVLACSYRLVVSQVEEILLEDGIPQSSSLDADKDQEFLFTLPNTTDVSRVTFSVTPLAGTARMWVVLKTEETDESNRLRAVESAYHGYSVGISEFNPKFIRGAQYIVGVKAVSDLAYTVLARTSQAVVTLRPGFPENAALERDFYEYFQVDIGEDEANKDLIIDVTGYSGDPDLYVSYRYPRPNRTHSDWVARDFGEDSLNISAAMRSSVGKPFGMYYISVLAYYSASSFSLVASLNQNGKMALHNGLVQSGFALATTWKYYSFDPPSQSQAITVTLSPRNGDADLYASLCNTTISRQTCTVTMATAAYRSNHSRGDDTIFVPASDLVHCNANCVLTIGVYAVRSSAFTVVARTADEDVSLQENFPLVDHVDTNAYKHYAFSISPDMQASFTRLTIQLTPNSGDPDLYLSSSYWPNKTHAEHSSEGHATDSISLTGSQIVPGEYYISVFGKQESEFSILWTATRNSSHNVSYVFLQPGQSQTLSKAASTSPACNYHAFSVRFPTDDARETVRIAVTPLTNNPVNVYIKRGTNPPPSAALREWDASQSLSASSSVDINRLDPLACNTCVYAIAVCPRDPAQAMTYSILATDTSTMVVLPLGVPQVDSVSTASYKYYKASTHTLEEELVISVTAFSGDPDVYVSFEDHHPTRTRYSAKSDMYGSDSVVIEWNGENQRYCSDRIARDLDCDYFIAVYGFAPANYTIQATLRTGIPSLLITGQSEMGSVITSPNFYRYTVPSTFRDEITVSLTPTSSGDADLYILLVPSAQVHHLTDLPRPNRDNPRSYNFSSVHATGVDEISLTTAQLTPCGPGCVLSISVWGYQPTEYMISVREGATVQALTEGVAVPSQVTTGEYVYFSLVINQPDIDGTITVTPIGSGDPDLYVSYGADSRPTRAVHAWSSDNSGGDTVTILHTDSRFRVGTYIVGVFGFRSILSGPGSVSFTLTFSTSDSPIVSLGNLPMSGSIRRNETKYYKFLPSHHADVRFTLTPTTGSAHIYVNRYLMDTVDDVMESDADYLERNDLLNYVPSPQKFQWASTTENTRDYVLIPKTDPAYPADQEVLFLIAVWAQSDTEFELLAKVADQASLLQVGTPYRSFVEHNGIERFQVVADSATADFFVSVTPLAGDPDLYVDTTYFTDLTAAKWQSVDYGRDVIQIPKTEFATGTTFHIAVKGEQRTVFSILASAGGDIINLIPGQPQLAMAPANQAVHFRYRTLGENSDLQVSVQATKGSVKMYMHTEDNFTPETAFWKAEKPSAADNSLSLVIDSKDAHFCSRCDYSIMVKADAAAGAEFTMTVSSAAAFTVLQDYVDRKGHVDLNQYQRYEYNLNQTADLHLEISACTGNPAVYVRYNHADVDNHTYDLPLIMQPGYGGKIKSTLNRGPGPVYFAVYGRGSESDYIITAWSQVAGTVYKAVEAGNSGELKLHLSEDGHFVVTVYPVVVDQVEIPTTYYVFATNLDTGKKSEVVMSTVCGIEQAEYKGYAAMHSYRSRVSGDLKGEPLEIPLKDLEPGHEYEINVLARATHGSKQESVAYVPERTFVTGSTGWPAWQIALVVIVALLVVGAGPAWWLWRRSKRLEKQLQYEMYDVRNMAQVRSGAPPAGAKGYSRLLTDERHAEQVELSHISAYSGLTPEDEEV
eukprot:GILK01006447.1.p1 GENE.GILK01006447.1~~GILK01006447.1.p1  ORF type:complete len:1757 (+),score=309.58 GILK01006447.1:95-5365(+)